MAASISSTPAPARRRPLVRAAAGSGGCLLIVAAARRLTDLADPGGAGPNPYHSWAPLCILVGLVAIVTAVGIVIHGRGQDWMNASRSGLRTSACVVSIPCG
jgi:hypothetical protein